MTHHAQNFIKTLDNIHYSKNRHDLFSDWLVMASATLYSTWKKDKKVEEEFLQVAKQYKQEELNQLSQLLAITVDALEEKEHDFLGEVFMSGEISNDRTGQFFTPYPISYMMAKMIIDEKEPPNNKVIRVTDPCCGAGGMLIAGAAVMKERGINFQRDVFFTGIDIDARCARMTYIQLSLIGAPAIVVCGNTLLYEAYWQRETIGYVISGMDFRLRAEKIIDTAKNIENENIEVKPESKKEQVTTEIIFPSARESVQGELFAMEENV